MKVFLTGITGLLGTNLAIALLDKGYLIRGLIRDKSRYKGPLHNNLELVQGNLSEEISPLLTDSDIVIHSAAETNQHLIRYSDYHSVNCQVTIRLVEAAIKCKVSKFIFVSTSNTIGFGSLNDLGDEQKQVRFPVSASLYAKSKLEAENCLLQYRDQIQIIIVNPGFMIGPNDSKPSSGRMILMGLDKRIVFYPEGGRSFVHVRDVVQGIINSLEKGVNGEKYLLVNENLTYREFFCKLNQLTQQKPLMVKVPKLLLMLLGYGGDVLRLLGIPTSISSVNMRILCIKNYYSNQKSLKELDLTYHPVDTAIAEAVKYFREVKYQRTKQDVNLKN